MCLTQRLLLVGVATAVVGCVGVSQNQPIPSWLVHIRPKPINIQAQTATFEQRLIHEFDSGASYTTATSPEQVAALAIHELERGNPWDAAVLLSIASYRRAQQARDIERSGLEKIVDRATFAGYRVTDRTLLAKFVEEEAGVFGSTVFEDELERVAALLGAAPREESIRRDWQRIAMGNVNDAYAAERTLKQRLQLLQEPKPEWLTHPALAYAYLRRLEMDCRADGLHFAAVRQLAEVPLKAFRLAALRNIRAPFDPRVVVAGV